MNMPRGIIGGLTSCRSPCLYVELTPASGATSVARSSAFFKLNADTIRRHFRMVPDDIQYSIGGLLVGGNWHR